MSDYIVPKSVKRLEDEIAELEKQFAPQEEQEENEEQEEEEQVSPPEQEEEEEELVSSQPLTKEEETFKKRYSDLRRHTQKLTDELKEVKALLSKKETSPGLPTAEEAEEWAKANPKAAAIIRALVANESSSTVEELSAVREKLHRSEQEARIFKAHPDFEAITSEDQFHDWAESQPERVQSLIYSSSADDVIWAINQYKKEYKVEKSNPKKEAAKAVSSKTSSAEPKTEGKGRFTESMVSKMSMSEYEKNEAAIQEAMRNGTFIYDLSGAAR